MGSMATVTPPAALPRSARRRRRILDAAGQAFAESGFAKTTVEEIARAAGVSKGLVYHHFAGKEEILEAVLVCAIEEWSAASGEIELDTSESVLEAIANMHRRALQYAREHPMLRALLALDPIVLNSVGAEPMRRAMQDFRARLTRAVARGIASGELRADLDPARLADVVRLLHMGFLERVLEPEWIDATDPALVEASLQVLFHGIAGTER